MKQDRWSPSGLYTDSHLDATINTAASMLGLDNYSSSDDDEKVVTSKESNNKEAQVRPR